MDTLNFNVSFHLKGWKIYKIILFVLYISSMYPWFTWSSASIPFLIIILGGFISAICYYINQECFSFNKKKNILGTFLLLLSFVIYIKGFTFIGIIQQIFVFINIIFLLNIKDSFKIDIFDFITKWMAILLSISLFFYILFLIGISLPFSVINDSEIGYTGNNYYSFLTNLDDSFFSRFRSIFAEPGHLTMGVIPLLYANRFNLKNKYVVILLLAEIFTFSLAGYITIFISLILFSFSPQVRRFYPRLIIFVLLASSILAFVNMDEENVIYVTIFSRLVFDEDKGTIAGSNRTDELTDEYFEKYKYSFDSILGLGNEKTSDITSEGGAGYKVFILRFGVLCFLIIFLFYFSFVISYLEFDVFGFFVILSLLLLQNTYPFWFCVSFTYITGISKLRKRIEY